MKRIKVLLKGDLKNIFRDGILLMSIIGPLLLAIVIKIFVPIMEVVLLENVSFVLSNYYDLILAITFILIPLLIGCMTGFILIEDKDEGLLDYYAITPLGKNNYLIYRLSLPVVFNILLLIFVFYFIDLITIPFISLLIIILLVSLEAIIIALFLTIYASNRVEAMALSKLINGFLIVIPVIDRIFTFKGQFMLAVSPTYWIYHAIKQVHSNKFLLTILLGLFVHLLYILMLQKQFNSKV